MKELLLVKSIKRQWDGMNLSYDPKCFDNNLHIRLKNFKVGDVIAGFESKLAFTLGYFLNLFIKTFPSASIDFAIPDNSEAIKQYIFSKYVNEFKQTPTFKALVTRLSTVIDFNDILIKPLYSKKAATTKMSQFGNVVNIIGDELLSNDLEKFTTELINKTSIENFLLDDSISLLITEIEEDKDIKEKYLNKNARKIAKELKKDNGYQQNKLW